VDQPQESGDEHQLTQQLIVLAERGERTEERAASADDQQQPFVGQSGVRNARFLNDPKTTPGVEYRLERNHTAAFSPRQEAIQ